MQQAYIALVQARNRVAVANVGLAQAREAFRLARVRYNAGVSQQTGISPQLELSSAQTISRRRRAIRSTRSTITTMPAPRWTAPPDAIPLRPQRRAIPPRRPRRNAA